MGLSKWLRIQLPYLSHQFNIMQYYVHWQSLNTQIQNCMGMTKLCCTKSQLVAAVKQSLQSRISSNSSTASVLLASLRICSSLPNHEKPNDLHIAWYSHTHCRVVLPSDSTVRWRCVVLLRPKVVSPSHTIGCTQSYPSIVFATRYALPRSDRAASKRHIQPTRRRRHDIPPSLLPTSRPAANAWICAKSESCVIFPACIFD
jgi:hypothetical protein